jgi:Mg-chelatase subunit ChlD
MSTSTTSQRSTPGSRVAEIILVLDRSGSMQSIRGATISSVNEFLTTQKLADGEAYITLYQFDHEFQAMCEATDARLIGEISEETYQPRGSTALLDAIGEAIERTRLRLDCCDNDATVIFAVMTDGYENASQRYNAGQIKNLLRRCGRSGWEVLFLGANMDAVEVATELGMQRCRAATFGACPKGVEAGIDMVSQKVARFRKSGVKAKLDFSAQDRADLAKHKKD